MPLPTRRLLTAVVALWFGGPACGLAADHVIADFTDATDRRGIDWSADSVDVTVGPRLVTERGSVLKLVVKQSGYNGVAFYAPKVPKDWSAHEALSFVVWSNDERDLAIRVDDHKSVGYNSRFNGGVRLLKGRNLVQIPLASIAKVIDLANIKLLNLFLDHPPAGLTVWIDDVKLGRLEAERTPFIPYAERLDHQPRMDVVSPHLPLAKPLAGGPLNAFLIAGVKQGREVVELMQRIDLAPSVLSWDREWGANTWGFGDAYGQRGSGLDCALMQRYLASSMQGPEKFEVLMLSTPMGWNRFGPAARQAILERVRDRGEGLVLVMPFTGERGQPWPEDLKALSALIDADADWVDDGGGVRQPREGREYGERWQVKADHPIVNGVPLEALPQQGMQIQKYQLAPGAQALITLAPREVPVVAVRQVGKGRVVTFATRGWSLTPLMDAPEAWVDRPAHRYWETWYALLSRAALWAANRPLARSGEAKVAMVGGEHADPWYTVRQWKDAQGKVTDWELAFANPDPQFQRIALEAPEYVDPAATIAVKFAPPDVLKDATWTAQLGELGDGRWRTLASAPVKDGAVSFPSARVRQPLALVKVLARRGEKVVAEGRAEVVVSPKPVWDDYETLTWYEQGLPFLSDVEMARMREFGLSGNTASPGNPAEWRRLFRGGMRIHPVGFADGLHAKDLEGQMRQWRETRDRAALVRRPSFAERAFADEQRSKTAAMAERIRPYGPLSYITSDETSLTSYTAEFDLDEHPQNVAAFRAKLKAQFGDIAALNAAFGTALASFDAVAPVTGAEAKESGTTTGTAALWNAWRSHNDDAWAGVFRLYGEALRGKDAAARLSVSGTQEQAVFNGIDWAKLSPELGAVSGYGGRWQELQRLCFQGPELRATPWCAYGRSGRSVDHQVWSNLLAGGDGMAMFWWFSLRNHDLTFCNSGKDYQRVVAEMRGGIGKQFMQSTRTFTPVAVLWSATSQRAAWLRGKFDAFKQAEAQVMNALYAAGQDPLLVSEQQVAAGDLAKRGVRVLVAPMTLALGRGDRKGGLPLLPAVQRLLDAGGAVVVTDVPELDEFLRPAALPDDVVKRLTRFDPAALASTLARAGAKPHVTLAPALGITPVLHAIDGPGGGRILTLLREPVGTREVVGADGVPYVERDDRAGPEVQAVQVGVAALGGATIIDCRSGKVLTPKDGAITVEVRAGDGHPLAVLPYRVAGLTAKTALANDDLTVSWQVQSDAKAISGHVVHVEVRGRDGTLLRHLVRNVTTGTAGAGTLLLPLAMEDGAGLTVHLRDVLTGATATAVVR